MTTESAEPNQRRRWQRWTRFRVRSALLLTLAFAVIFTWISAQIHRARKQQAAVSAITGMSGYVRSVDVRLTPFNRVNQWVLDVFGDDFTRRVVAVEFQGAHGKRWTEKESRLYGANATAEQLSRWEPWTLDNVLGLKSHLQNLPELETLSFWRTVVPRHALRAVSCLHSLRHLNLEQTQITSADLQHLTALQRLETLSLRRTRIRNDGVEHLASLRGLKSLNLGSTAIGDRGLEHLTRLTNIETLNLQNTKVSDSGLRHLHGLRHLRQLDIRYTDVTSAGYESLREALPNCEVRFGGRKRS